MNGLPPRIAQMIDATLGSKVRYDEPGMVVAAAVAGRIVYQRAFGLANVEHRVANSLATRMPIGSVTKQFTAMAALILSEQGKLDIDAGIRRYIPDLPQLSGVPTIRQLLDHRGGYRDYLDTAFGDGFALKPAGEVLAFHKRQQSVNFAPGSAQLYSNSGFYLVSLVLEQLTGTPFEQLLKELIFSPLGMRNSLSVRNDWPVLPGLADAYLPLGKGEFRRGVNVSQERLGDGAIYATVGDMLIWLEALRTEKALVSRDSWRSMKRVPTLPNGQLSHYALGLQIGEHRGDRLIEHGGGVMGAVSHILTLPARAIDVVVLANTVAPARSHALSVVDALLDRPAPSGSPSVIGSGDAAMSGAYYCAERGWLFRFERAGGALAVSQSGGSAVPLSRAGGPAGRGEFTLPTPTGEMHFSVDAKAEAKSFTLRDAGQTLTFLRVEPQASDVLMAELTGQFRNEATETRLAFHRETDGERRWIMTAQGGFSREKFVVTPQARDIFTIRHTLMPYFATFSVVREAGQIVRLDFSTSRTWRLPFVRKACA